MLLPSKQRLDGLTRQQGGALKALGAGPIAFTAPPPEPVADLLGRLVAAGALVLSVAGPTTAGYSIRPFRAAPAARPAEPTATSAVLSRFTIVRRDGEHLVAENPRSFADVVIADPALLGTLSGPGHHPSGPADDVAQRFRDDLLWTGHAVAEAATEDGEFPTASWSPHELWFHRRSTIGDRGTAWLDFGPTRWADGRFEPLPAAPAAFPGEPLALPVPDLAALRATDMPLAAATEDRVSTRTFDDDAPLTAAHLGELLFRTARTRSVRTVNADRAVPEELPSKPYASGGSLYELEVYPIVRHADGIPAGMYHYDSAAHTLEPVAGIGDDAVQRLIAPAALTLADGRPPQVLLVLAARPGRMMWTYEQMAYAVILKHVGVLTHSLYLAATAMGLGGVAQGYSDTAAFAAATGRPELTETPVGTFAVGTR